ncbi:MAG: winged helix-turn-helix domain-containing protein, partial [Candidatus Odinarchaeota archaeon]
MESNFYYALGHDLRRKIIKIIGDNEFSSFTTLKKELKVSTGTIYHHLDALSQLIEQRKDKKYYLTELGQHAY